MSTMKVTQIHDYGSSDVLCYEDAPRPEVKAGEVLIRVHAAAVNPVDWKLRSGHVRARFELPMPCRLGGDIAGVVEAVGEGVDKFAPGDNVYAMIGLWGAYAEYVSVNADLVAASPSTMTMEEAASVPLAALTAWQGLHEKGGLASGQTVLVHGGSGGVGGFAVQLAKAAGATVYASASAKNADYVKSLGADGVFDFRDASASAAPQNVDLVMDAIGDAESLPKLFNCLKEGGTVVQVAPGGSPEATAIAEQKKATTLGFQVHPDGGQLAEIASLIDAGKVRTEIAAAFPLAEAGKAHDMSMAGHTRGKIVLTCI
jgi:NADPH:quinone reductase-like Zn-dependent oxidoreductase